jgi:hypothetical protein
MTVSMHRVQATLSLPANTSALLIRARAIVEAMTDNPWFPAPVPSLAKVAAIDALEKAQTDVLSRTKGLPALRNGWRSRTGQRVLIESLRTAVRELAGRARKPVDHPLNASFSHEGHARRGPRTQLARMKTPA